VSTVAVAGRRHAAPSLSIIVPAYNAEREIVECLAALRTAVPPDAELIVVDDASTDETPNVAKAAGATVLRLARNAGPAAARNHGVAHAEGDVVLFVDADVIVAPGAVGRVARHFTDDPGLAALFGSYDDRPRAPGLVSRYRNLLHHFVHHAGRAEASTFWSGLGAVRRAAFLAVGGFDVTRFAQPSIEDIELGVRLRRAGYRIRLDPAVQGTHLKRWTLASMVRTDVTRRALPWARLIAETAHMPTDLNLSHSQRVTAVLAGVAMLAIVLVPLRPMPALAIALGALAGVAVLNRRFYALLWRRGGFRLLAAGFPLHVLFFLYSGATFVYAALEARVAGRKRRR
jgi:glycosyl transferase family 2